MTTPDTVPAYYKTRIGELTLIALHDGTVSFPLPEGFITNAPDDQTAAAMRQSGMAEGKLSLTFTVFAIERAGRLVLIDTGFGENGPPTAGRMLANLRAAGHDADAVDTILISHFHSDHIAGLITAAGAPVFPQARVMVPRAEYDHWMDDARMASAPEGQKDTFALARRVMAALGDRVAMMDWDSTPVPGVRAIRLDGHTPGMTGFEITSGGDSLTFVADVSNNPTVFARHPDWHARFDMDGDKAEEVRQRVFAEAAASHRRLAFFHAPFPSIGTLAPVGDAYAWCPAIWGVEG